MLMEDRKIIIYYISKRINKELFYLHDVDNKNSATPGAMWTREVDRGLMFYDQRNAQMFIAKYLRNRNDLFIYQTLQIL
jgi:hypothetical protein